MTREEVIRGLECCTAELGNNQHRDDFCAVCPYRDKSPDNWYCFRQQDLMRDALALIREQEPVAPVLQSGGNYVCGNCGMYTVGYMHPLTGESVQTWKYCGKCGKKVKWE